MGQQESLQGNFTRAARDRLVQFVLETREGLRESRRKAATGSRTHVPRGWDGGGSDRGGGAGRAPSCRGLVGRADRRAGGHGVRGSRAGRRVRRGGTCARVGGGEATGATAARARKGRGRAGGSRARGLRGPLSAGRPGGWPGGRARPAPLGRRAPRAEGKDGRAGRPRGRGAADPLTSACFRTTLSGLSRFPRSR